MTAKNIMDNRVNGAGFTEAQVQQQGSNIINVAVPGRRAPEGREPGRADRAAAVPPGAAAGAEHGDADGYARPRRPALRPASAAPRPARRASASSTAKTGAAPAGAAAAGAREMASRSHTLTAAHAKASASPSASASASGQRQPVGRAPATSSSGAVHRGRRQRRRQPGQRPVKAQFNKLNCADKNWKQEVGYTSQQYNNPNIQTVSCGSLNGVSVQVRAGQGQGAGQGHQVGQRHASPDLQRVLADQPQLQSDGRHGVGHADPADVQQVRHGASALD